MNHNQKRKIVRFKKINKKCRTKNHKRKKKNENLNILYTNPNGITGKTASLASAAAANDSHIITLAETKLGPQPPRIEGYQWINKNRITNGGGVAILLRTDVAHMCKEVTDLEDHDQEICWIEVKATKRPTYIGIFYRPQEKVGKEEAARQYSQIKTQIIKLKARGEIILTGDFNAKIAVNQQHTKQEPSRNGRLLMDLIEETHLEPVSVTKGIGSWTRINRKNSDQKSIIDYVLMTPGIAANTNHILIDEAETNIIQGKEKSDHNTIIIETNLGTTSKVTKEKIWDLKNKESWKKFNARLTEKSKETPPETYSQLDQQIRETLRETMKTITITKGQTNPKKTKKIKELTRRKKQARKEFENAPTEEKEQKLHEYIKAQRELRTENEEDGKRQVQQKIEKLAKEGGVKSNHFWKIRKKIMQNQPDNDYDTITEDGRTLNDPDETKEYIAQFYENLYQAREGTPEYQRWTDHIKTIVKIVEKQEAKLPPEENFTKKELNKAIKSLKRNKAMGPDKIPNEVFIEADDNTKHLYLEVINKIMTLNEIPQQWTEGTLKRLYKGKGKKGKCSNERGITLASNFGKVFERLLNNRATPRINLSDAQAGGTKGRATTDHILILKELSNIARMNKRPMYIVYLDVTKAYDKAWLDAIMYVLYKQGIKSKLWSTIKKINESLTTEISTKHGLTRKIKITDSIRQGGVLSVILYALMMDETNKAMKETDMGIKIPGTEIVVPSLLWMDDVAITTTSIQETQKLLDITEDTSLKYHIQYGQEKSQALAVGKSKSPLKLKMGPMELKETDKYKYLGEMNNRKMNLEDQINNIEGKVEAAYQTMLTIAEDREFKNVKMEAIWTLLTTCIIPVITYGSETWETTAKETKKLNQILDSIIRRILMTPTSTPREALYIETGLLDIQTLAKRNRLNMYARLLENSNELIKAVINYPGSMWRKTTESLMDEMTITQEDLEMPRYTRKRTIKEKTMKAFKTTITEGGENKTKVQHLLQGKNHQWSPGKPSDYMNKLTRKQTSTIFKTRTRMIQVKSNYKNAYTSLTCRACYKEEETQQHVLETCATLHPDETTKTNQDEIFTEDIPTLILTADKITLTMEKLNKINPSAAPSTSLVERPGDPGTHT